VLQGDVDRWYVLQGDVDRRSPRRISRTVHDSLAEIFKKIGSKENTREVS